MRRHKHKRTKALLPRVANPTKKGSFDRHIIMGGNDTKRDYLLHATKGYRSYKAVT